MIINSKIFYFRSSGKGIWKFPAAFFHRVLIVSSRWQHQIWPAHTQWSSDHRSPESKSSVTLTSQEVIKKWPWTPETQAFPYRFNHRSSLSSHHILSTCDCRLLVIRFPFADKHIKSQHFIHSTSTWNNHIAYADDDFVLRFFFFFSVLRYGNIFDSSCDLLVCSYFSFVLFLLGF